MKKTNDQKCQVCGFDNFLASADGSQLKCKHCCLLLEGEPPPLSKTKFYKDKGKIGGRKARGEAGMKIRGEGKKSVNRLIPNLTKVRELACFLLVGAACFFHGARRDTVAWALKLSRFSTQIVEFSPRIVKFSTRIVAILHSKWEMLTCQFANVSVSV